MTNHPNRKKLPFIVRDLGEGDGRIIARFESYDVAGGFAAFWSRAYRCTVEVWADHGRNNDGNGIVASIHSGEPSDEFTPFNCVIKSGVLPDGTVVRES